MILRATPGVVFFCRASLCPLSLRRLPAIYRLSSGEAYSIPTVGASRLRGAYALMGKGGASYWGIFIVIDDAPCSD